MADATESPRESTASRREPSRPATAEETEQLVVTISAATGEIVKVEKVDKAGKRDELSEEELTPLTAGWQPPCASPQTPRTPACPEPVAPPAPASTASAPAAPPPAPQTPASPLTGESLSPKRRGRDPL